MKYMKMNNMYNIELFLVLVSLFGKTPPGGVRFPDSDFPRNGVARGVFQLPFWVGNLTRSGVSDKLRNIKMFWFA